MDPLLLIPVPFILVLAVMGFRDGVVKRLVEIAGVIATVILTARFAASAQPWVMAHTGAKEAPALLITWALLFLAGLILSRIIAVVVSKMVHLTILGWLDRLGGALLGALLGVLLASAVLLVLGQAPGGRDIQQTYAADPFGQFIYEAAPNVYQGAHRLWGGHADEVWSKVMNKARETADEAKAKAKEKLENSRDQLEEAAKKGTTP